MREKYETLAVRDLREIAKIRGIKGASSMSKGQLIDAMVQLDMEGAETKDKSENVSKAIEDAAKKAELPEEEKAAIREKEIKERREAKKKRFEEEAAKNESTADKKVPSKKKVSVNKEALTNKEAATDKEASKDTANKEVSNNEAVASDKNDNKPAYRAVRKSDRKPSAESPETSDKESGKSSASESSEAKNQGDNATSEAQNASQGNQEKRETGAPAHGILEVMADGYGFIRCDNFLPGVDDVYVAPGMIRKYGLRTGDIIDGITKVKTQNEKFSALLFIQTVNGFTPDTLSKRVNFENMTPIFPDNRINLETPGASVAMRVMDLLSPVGKGQRGMIVSPPKAGKTTLLKEVAKSVKRNNPDIHMIILLIDERPEEVTDIKESIEGPNVEVIYSTFDELPEHHKRVSEMVIERAKRLVEHHKDVMILLDSITRLTRAYNLTVQPSGRTLSGGLDPAALHMPKKFFGAARNMREGGSLTILATALVETGSKMDDVVYEEFKGTGNMEMVLDRKLSEKRIFPAIDIAKSGTRREDLLLSKEEQDAVNTLRKGINGLKPDESVDRILDMFSKTRGNRDFISMVNKIQLF